LETRYVRERAGATQAGGRSLFQDFSGWDVNTSVAARLASGGDCKNATAGKPRCYGGHGKTGSTIKRRGTS